MQPIPRFCGMAAICTFRQRLGSTYRRYYKSHRRDQYGSRAASIWCDISMPGVRVKRPLFVRPSAKTNAGMGGRHRSQHVLLPLFKVGSAAHNNELGNRGRRRSKTSGTYLPPRRPTTIPPRTLRTTRPSSRLRCLRTRSSTSQSWRQSSSTRSSAWARLGLPRTTRPHVRWHRAGPALRRCDAATGNPALPIEARETLDALAGRRSKETALIEGRISRREIPKVGK
jgi:hypothetical protein